MGLLKLKNRLKVFLVVCVGYFILMVFCVVGFIVMVMCLVELGVIG